MLPTASYCLNRPVAAAVAAMSTLLVLLLSGLITVSAAELKLGAAATYEIELAVTPQQRQKGLMHRPEIGPRQGMLLVYPAPGDRRIWMKNVLMPLRVYWIDASFTVIHAQRLEPCSGSPCPVYGASGDSLFVLELGDYEHPLAPGDRIEGLSGLR